VHACVSETEGEEMMEKDMAMICFRHFAGVCQEVLFQTRDCLQPSTALCDSDFILFNTVLSHYHMSFLFSIIVY
jgi:hypothetical protein